METHGSAVLADAWHSFKTPKVPFLNSVPTYTCKLRLAPNPTLTLAWCSQFPGVWMARGSFWLVNTRAGTRNSKDGAWTRGSL